MREKGGLEVIDVGAPIDVLWMRLARAHDPNRALGRFRAGKILMTLDRGDYWQCAYVIPKGAFEEIRKRGLPAFREDIVNVAPFLRERVGELKDWNDIKLLSVRIDRLRRWWRTGFCASATRRMQCLRSEVSASIWRFRTLWLPRTFWRGRCSRAR